VRDPLNIEVNRHWPDETTQVFRVGEPNRNLAWIPQTGSQWDRYAEGYREAADRIYQSWREISNDALAFPIVFLFRHYVELRIKELLQSVERLLDLPKGWTRSHDIADLWRRLRPLLQRADSDQPVGDFENAQRLIVELARNDALAMEFRFPEDNVGKRHLADMERLDLVNFYTAMQKLSAFLDGASMAISVYLDLERQSANEA
jgi:hypothetical protein